MLKNLDKGLIISIFASLFSGAVIFILLYGFGILNPLNTNWIVDNNWEISQHYIGWIFFRKAGWTFPIGLFDGLSYPDNTSILNSDSIPLLAIPFKILSPILPQKFQYFGIFGLICYSLQSLLGMILVRKHAGNIISVLSGILFALIPGLTLKMQVQTSLSAMWLILLALIPIVYCDELKLKHKIIIYSLTGFLASLIHPYYIVMCGIIALADTVYEICISKRILPSLIVIFYSFFCILNYYILGFFNMNTIYIETLDKESLFMKVGINLDSFFNPILIELTDEAYCAYLGRGIILLILIVLVTGMINEKKVFINKPKIILYTCLVVISVFLALSPVIMLDANTEIIKIQYPDFVLNLFATVRYMARIVFIALNIILLLAIIYCASTYKKKTIAILLVCIFLQIGSITSLKTEKSNMETDFLNDNTFALTKSIWNKIGDNNNIETIYFDKIIIDQTSNRRIKPHIVNLISNIAQIACDKDIKLNHFYLAKPLKSAEKNFYEVLRNPDKKNLLIFLQEDYAAPIVKRIPYDYFYIVDDVILVRSEPIIGLEEYKISKDSL